MADQELIDGLKIDVPGRELIDWLEQKAAEHQHKADTYASQSRGISELQADDDHVAAMSNNPTYSLAQSAKQHQNQAVLMQFMASHLDATAMYRLDQSDLVLAEILNRGGW